MIRTMVRRVTGGRWPEVRVGDRLSCAEVGRRLQRFLDDELVGEAEVAALVAHLDECARCGLEAETYRRIKQAIEDRRIEIPAESIARLREFGQRLGDGRSA